VRTEKKRAKEAKGALPEKKQGKIPRKRRIPSDKSGFSNPKKKKPVWVKQASKCKRGEPKDQGHISHRENTN